MTILTKESLLGIHLTSEQQHLEDNTKQSLKADASLYNGQPTGTGSLCPSARPTSCTPSISDEVRGGVAVRNVPLESKRWFVLRVSYGRIIKAKAYLEEKGVECYAPMRYKQITKQGKKRIVTESLHPSFLFVRATCGEIESLRLNVNASDSRALLVSTMTM